jgi:hypothetical protein
VPASSGGSLLEVLKRATDVLKKDGVQYVLVGAWALAVWGRPRATVDLDLLVLVDEADLDRIGALMARAGMSLDNEWLDANPMLRGIQRRFHSRGVTVDLMRPRDVHDRQLFRRKRQKRIDSRLYWVVAPEDFILQKLKVGRPRDFEDALSGLDRSKKNLDLAYVRRWAKKLGVQNEWEYLQGGA